MKTIKLPVSETFNGTDVLKGLIGGAPEKGYTINDVRTCIRIVDKVQADGTLVLEDAEYTFLKDRIDAVKWSVATADVVAFVDAISAPE